MTDLDLASRVCNRACMATEISGLSRGDRAPASLLYVHGMIMNGSVDHAHGIATPVEWLAVVRACEFV